MKKILLSLFLVLFMVSKSFALLATNTMWQVQSTATSGNINGGGFSFTNTNFATDGAITTANTSSASLSSASYAFVAGDIGAYAWIKGGANTVPGFYPITNVTSGAAILNCSAGVGEVFDGTNFVWSPSPQTGCGTAGTLSSVTYGVDYSRLDTAPLILTDLASVGGSSLLTSVTGGFGTNHVGNIIHITTQGTGSHFITNFFEIVTVSNLNTAVLDRTPNDGTAGLAGTGQTGGALKLDANEDFFFENIPTASTVWIKGGAAYIISATVSVTSGVNSEIYPGFMTGFTTTRGDACNGTNRPTLTLGANTFLMATFFNARNLQATSTSSGGFNPSTSGHIFNCKFLNTSITSGRYAATLTGANAVAMGSEFVSLNGSGINWTSGTFSRYYGNYIHDCGISGGAGVNQGLTVEYNTFARNVQDSINDTRQNANIMVAWNTIFGRQAKMGAGVNLPTIAETSVKCLGNNFYGLTNGILVASAGVSNSMINLGYRNNFFNNTIDIANYGKNYETTFLNPQFQNASEITGSAATSVGSVLGDVTANFTNVVDNMSILRVTSGTLATNGGYLITGHSTTNLTVSGTIGTSSAGDLTYFVGVGSNFTPGNPAIKIGGFPNISALGSGAFTSPPIGGVPINPDAFAGSIMQ